MGGWYDKEYKPTWDATSDKSSRLTQLKNMPNKGELNHERKRILSDITIGKTYLP